MHRALSLLIVVATCSCRSPSSDASQGTKASPTPPASTTQAAVPSPTGPATAPSGGFGSSIGEMLMNETASRPTGTPRVEDALAAFGAQGVVIASPKQHLARPVGAKYCVGGSTAAGTSLSICEYADAAAAAAGRDTSNKAFGSIQNREIHVNKATTLTVLQSPVSDATRAEVAKLTGAFAKL